MLRLHFGTNNGNGKPQLHNQRYSNTTFSGHGDTWMCIPGIATDAEICSHSRSSGCAFFLHGGCVDVSTGGMLHLDLAVVATMFVQRARVCVRVKVSICIYICVYVRLYVHVYLCIC